MKTLPQCPLDELYLLHTRATLFMSEHREHVKALIRAAEYSYPPSGSDRFKPELWKEAHWKWYSKNRNFIKNVTMGIAYQTRL